MKSELVLKSETGESVTTVAKVQETGRVSLGDCLAAMNIPKEKWKDTYLQIHVMLLPTEDG